MTNNKVTGFLSKGFWVRETLNGGTEYRTSSKVLFTILPILLAALFYMLLISIEGLDSGREILVILAYGLGVLLAVLTLVVLMISLIEMLRKLE